MRAIINFKSSNLSWSIVLRHFMNYSRSHGVFPRISVNERIINGESAKVSTVHESLVGAVNKPISLSGNIFPIENSIESKLNTPDLGLFNDRYVHQMEIMSNITQPNNLIMDNSDLECTTHTCLLPLRRDLRDLFPNRNLVSEESPLTVVCLNHHTKENMSNWDSSVSNERLNVANLFVKSSVEICASLAKCGFWADFIDPFSGTPFYGDHTNDTLFETDPRMRNFGLQINDLGCCKVLCHPVWKENVFTGVIFTDAPSDHPILSLSHHNSL